MRTVKQSVRDIFVSALSLKAHKAQPAEIKKFIMDVAQENHHRPKLDDGEETFSIVFSSGQKISFDGIELNLT